MNADRKFSQRLEDDIAERIESVNAEASSDDEPYTRADAIMEIMMDMDDPDHWTFEHRKELRSFGAEIGVYEGHTKEYLDANVMTSSGRKYDFKRGGLYYSFDSWDPIYS